jgi:uncharacterized membrane protein
MEVVGPDARRQREAVFRLAFGRLEGYICIATMSATKARKFEQEFFAYPQDMEVMLDFIESCLIGHNIYFCPQILDSKKREKANVSGTPNIWADLDFCSPDKVAIPPSVILESSPERYQALWCLEKPMDPDDAEDLSRRIAYKHAEEGADRSGWDLTQLLRVPLTYNYKYLNPLNKITPTVNIITASRLLYRAQDFDEDYPETGDYTRTDIPIPEAADIEDLVAEDLLQAKRKELNPRIWGLFVDEPPEKTWSTALWNLEMLLFEAGFSRVEVFVIAREAKCNKYARDGRPAVLLWKDVCRAEQRAELHHKLLVEKPDKFYPLLSEEERELVENAEATFVERYIEWATSLGDAAPQYHQAGAFVALSSLLAGSVRLPTSYGTIVPNIWFMILADTTLTRKTTAMDIAMDLVMDVDEDAVMATDGSLEGLLTSLASRPGRPSVFLRDEFSGLLEQMTKKDYMAGMPEMLTKLYDGKMQKRILRKEVIEVRDPRLIFFAGGIKNKITSLLTFEYVSSGFMPRFVFITAESDVNRIKPIGPPVTQTTGARESILAELFDIAKHYDRSQAMHVGTSKQSFERKVVYDAEMETEAWIRYNELEALLLDKGLKTEKPDIMTPIGDRLAKSILKAAILIAASRQRNEEGKVLITKLDILRAIRYGEQWRTHAQEVMDNVGKSQSERELDTILRAIRRAGTGVTRSVIMQNYHLSARDASLAFETLEQRGLITRQKAGRTELLIPVGR